MASGRLGPKKRLSKLPARPLRMEQLEERALFASLPFGALEPDTGEFMLGRIAVTPVLLESNGTFDTSTENWNSTLIQQALTNLQTGLQWWNDALALKSNVHTLEWVIDDRFAVNPVPTAYEPISRTSNDYGLWTREFLNNQGFNQTLSIDADMRAFNHYQRERLQTDWAFTLFIVNSTADSDGNFLAGGNFTRAFAFAGGLFIVMPSSRPASTYAHEVGHIFWSRDEYSGGGSFTQRRGYYNTQNLNASDNNTPGFVQQPSIMASGTLLTAAYNSKTSPDSTFAQVGWQDSDSDGIFDVLDVPLKLEGSGFRDVSTNRYRFTGSATVQTLNNLNPSGLKNNITLNKIARIEYRFDGGAWQTGMTVNDYTANVSLSVAIPEGAQNIEVRAVGNIAGIESSSYVSEVSRAGLTELPGINGIAWIDTNQDGDWDPGEIGEAGWSVQLVNASGVPLNLQQRIEPDNYPDGHLASGFSPFVALSAVGIDTDGRVGAFTDSPVSTGTKGFRVFSTNANFWMPTWTEQSRRFQATFTSSTTQVEIDAIGSGNESYARMEGYNSAGQLVARVTSSKLTSGQVTTLRLQRAENDIAYVIVSGHVGTSIRLDNLRFGVAATTTTTSYGNYQFPYVPPGTYNVKVTAPSSRYVAQDPLNGIRQVTVTAQAPATDVEFRYNFNPSRWQNPTNRLDVNNREGVSPIDALLIINDLNVLGPRSLDDSLGTPPPYVDVNGDGSISPIDALLVINFLNSNGDAEGSGDEGSTNDNESNIPPTAPSQSPIDNLPSNERKHWVSPTPVAPEQQLLSLDHWMTHLSGLSVGGDSSSEGEGNNSIWDLFAQRTASGEGGGMERCGCDLCSTITSKIDSNR